MLSGMRLLFLLLAAACAFVGFLALQARHIWIAILEFALAGIAVGTLLRPYWQRKDEDA
jgi:membrane protein implicated in regulation of membrane protease activity